MPPNPQISPFKPITSLGGKNSNAWWLLTRTYDIYCFVILYIYIFFHIFILIQLENHNKRCKIHIENDNFFMVFFFWFLVVFVFFFLNNFDYFEATTNIIIILKYTRCTFWRWNWIEQFVPSHFGKYIILIHT